MTDEELAAPAETEAAEPGELAIMTTGHESAAHEPSQVRVEWQDITAGEDTLLADPVTTVALTNESDTDATLVLQLVGDYGTTRTEYLDLGETNVGAGATVVVPVDLSALYAGKTMTYAGRAHISAKVMVGGVQAEQVVGDELFYHPVLSGVALYDETQLIDAHAAGDISNLAPEALLTDDPEEQATVRIVAFEAGDGKPSAKGFGVLGEGTDDQQEHPTLIAAATAAGGNTQEVCVRFEVQTVDSGFQSSNGVTEDVWPTANNGEEHTANYVRVKVDGQALTTDSSGCATFNTTWFSGHRDVRVWAMAERSNGTYVRIHNAAADTEASYPGNTRSWVVKDVWFTTFGSGSDVVAGNASERATMMGALSRSLHRYSFGLASGTEIHVAEDSTGVWPTPINYANDFTNNESYLSVLTAQGLRRQKFLVAHEYGHAYLHQYAGSWAPDDQPGLTSIGPGCEDRNPGYDSNSEEWSSTAFTEGYAHFVSARIWNHQASNGWFNFGGGQRSELEKFNSANDPGGQMVNTCCQGNASCTPAADGHGVIFDWMRALWDFHDGGGSCSSLSHTDMAVFFALVVLSNPLRDEYYSVSETVSAWFGASCASWWEQLACHNGINMDGSTWSQPC